MLIQYPKDFFVKIFFSFFIFYSILNIFNNSFFFFFLNNLRFFKKIQTFGKFSPFNYFFDYFFKKYFLKKFDSNLCIKFNHNNFYFLDKKGSFSYCLKFFKKILVFSKTSLIFFKLILKVFLNFFFFLDSKLFTNWINQLGEGSDLRSHKSFFFFLKIFLDIFFKKFYFLFKIKGYFFQIKGKISGGGNSKKRKFTFKNGLSNLSNNFLKVSYSKTYIRTFSGVLGLLFFICY